MKGRNIPNIYPFATELLEGQSLGSGLAYWTIPIINYIAGNFRPIQTFGIYTDGTNWFLKN